MLLHSLQPGSLRRHCARNVFAPIVLFCLFTVLLFTGCDVDGGTTSPLSSSSPTIINEELDNNLIGKWTDSIFFDGYTITTTHLSYDDGYGGTSSYAGTIRYAASLSNNAGVIIIEYDDGKEPKYWIYDSNYNPTSEVPRPGNFLGIYYQNLTPGVSVQMSGAIDPVTYLGVEAATLDAAKNKFTVDAVNNYVTWWGGPYEK